MQDALQNNSPNPVTSKAFPIPATISLLYAVAGFLFFFVNHIIDKKINIPIGEFALIGVLIIEMMRQKKLIFLPVAHFLLFAAVLLILLCSAVDLYHTGSIGSALRVAIRTTLFYAIILFYIHIPDKRIAFTYCLGMVAGYVGLFVCTSLFYFLTQPKNIYFQLKYLIPTPAIIMLIVVMMKRHIPRLMWLYLVGYLVFSLLAMPLIGSRGAFISLIVGGAIYMLARVITLPRGIYIALALALPLVPCIVGLYFYEPNNPTGLTEWLFEVDYATMSNIERTLMYNASITTMLEHPLLGIGSSGIVPMVEPYFTMLANVPKHTGDSPHNYYLEFAVPFGVPSMVLILVILSQLYRLMFVSSVRLTGMAAPAAAAMVATGWIMLYQPVAGITRIDIFILMMTVFYGFSTHLPERIIAAKPVLNWANRGGKQAGSPAAPAGSKTQ